MNPCAMKANCTLIERAPLVNRARFSVVIDAALLRAARCGIGWLTGRLRALPARLGPLRRWLRTKG
jgi:hypothetical protein